MPQMAQVQPQTVQTPVQGAEVPAGNAAPQAEIDDVVQQAVQQAMAQVQGSDPNANPAG